MGILSGIGNVLGKVGDIAGDVLGGIGEVANFAKGIMDSPLGGLIAAVFPPAAAVMGGLNMVSMVTDIAGQVGGGETY
jgi:hypothetical protein